MGINAVWSVQGEPQLIVAGLEPIEFVNLFPCWHYRKDVALIQSKVRVMSATRVGLV